MYKTPEPFTPHQIAEIRFASAGIIYLLRTEQNLQKLIEGLLEANKMLRGINNEITLPST